MGKRHKESSVTYVGISCVVAAQIFQQYTYRSYLPEVKQQIPDMAVNGSGMRDTARVLKISRNTVTAVLKKTSPSEAGKRKFSSSDKPNPNERKLGTCRSSRNG